MQTIKEMGDQLQLEKWEGKVSVDLCTNDIQAWSLLSDFFNLHLWLPGIATCEKVTESESLPGSVRYVASPADEPGKPVNWAKEELIRFDPVERSFSYKVVDSNMGFGEYVGHFRVLPAMGEGCRLEWSFECEPVVGWTQEGLVGYLDWGLKGMAERIEKATCKVNGEAMATDKLNGKAEVDAKFKANDEVKVEVNCEANGA